MMYTLHSFFAAILTLIIIIHGDDNVVYPSFPRQAEFTIEHLKLDGQDRRTHEDYIYDYDNNYLIKISEHSYVYYNYTSLTKAVYLRDTLQQCTVYPIDIDNSSDGLSGVTDPDDSTTHIRPLNDFFLLTSNATYFGENIQRGSIHVNQWISALINDSDIIWSFTKSNYLMPWNSTNYSIPIQRIRKRKSDGFISEIFNIFSYKTKIVKTDILPPKGIFCNDSIPENELISLEDFNIKFPDKFSVRIDASTTVQQLWHSVHLRYRRSRERKLIRYDYTPFDNTQTPMTIIFDDTEDAPRAYKIDRRTGSCVIEKFAAINSLLSILHNPIESLIKYENFLISKPPEYFFQHIGSRPCRGSILCSTFIGQISSFPLDSDDNWLSTSIEWGWSKRFIDDSESNYDYPVYLNLNLYKNMNEPPANVHYEFYDYRTDVHLDEFDVNLCYRSNQLWYEHLAFQLKITNQTIADGIENISINRRALAEYIRAQMMSIMSLKYLRISQLEIDHHPNQPGHNDTLYCIFTLLDRTPFVDPNSEIELLDAKNKLEFGINNGQMHFHTDDGLTIEAISGSLENIQYFYAFNPNISINQIDYFSNTTVHVNRTIVETIEEVYEKVKYSDGAQTGAVIGGMLVGLVLGAIAVLFVIRMIKRKAEGSPSGGLTFRNISFRVGNKRTQETIAMQNPLQDIEETTT
ncbi:unnamed protein product [Rotaria magnacalcarata]|uniref:Uncharacterized protein n=7 Tax=Rotaria magnacalcarata TaxID=392030 RepID=A0A816D5W8_9BILA|nr:unnamed protein product [Rotaria magnacalcarata]